MRAKIEVTMVGTSVYILVHNQDNSLRGQGYIYDGSQKGLLNVYSGEHPKLTPASIHIRGRVREKDECIGVRHLRSKREADEFYQLVIRSLKAWHTWEEKQALQRANLSESSPHTSQLVEV